MNAECSTRNIFGFVPDLTLSPLQNSANQFGDQPKWLYFSRPSHTAFHNLCNTKNLPPHIKSLLGLGLNFCVVPRTTKTNYADTSRFKKDIYTKFFFAHHPETSPPQLFLRSDWEPSPSDLPAEFRTRISQFKTKIDLIFRKQRLPSNLTKIQRAALNYLLNNKKYIVIKSDKNLGPVLLHRSRYVQLAFTDHLNDEITYRRLTKQEADGRILAIKKIVCNFVDEHLTLTDNKKKTYSPDGKYILRSLSTSTPYSQFYLLAKIHKSPLKTRPIISASGSILYGLGKWLNIELQKVIKHLPYVTNSSRELVEELKNLQPSHSWKTFTCDARSFYTNVDTEHALSSITEYFNESNICLKAGIDKHAVLMALTIIMRHSVFQFDDTFWLQQTGSAMGVPPAPPYATLYFCIWELKFIHAFPHLIFYRRYIDDGFGIWDISIPNSYQTWLCFQRQFDKYGKLRWDFSNLSHCCVFLDLTITINDGKIQTTLYEKVLNSYLYLPPHSAHPPGVLKSLITGTIHRIDTLSFNSDQTKTNLLHNLAIRLVRRGYKLQHILDQIHHTLQLNEMTKRNNITTTSNRTSSTIPNVFHLTFYPTVPTSKRIQQTFEKIVRKPFREPHLKTLSNNLGGKLTNDQLIVAHHRVRNLGNLLSYRKFSAETASISHFLDGDTNPPC